MEIKGKDATIITLRNRDGIWSQFVSSFYDALLKSIKKIQKMQWKEWVNVDERIVYIYRYFYT